MRWLLFKHHSFSADLLDCVIFRAALIAALRSKHAKGIVCVLLSFSRKKSLSIIDEDNYALSSCDARLLDFCTCSNHWYCADSLTQPRAGGKLILTWIWWLNAVCWEQACLNCCDLAQQKHVKCKIKGSISSLPPAAPWWTLSVWLQAWFARLVHQLSRSQSVLYNMDICSKSLHAWLVIDNTGQKRNLCHRRQNRGHQEHVPNNLPASMCVVMTILDVIVLNELLAWNHHQLARS